MVGDEKHLARGLRLGLRDPGQGVERHAPRSVNPATRLPELSTIEYVIADRTQGSQM